MRPPQVTVNFGTPPEGSTPRTSSEFEEVQYPTADTANWTSVSRSREEELPLHYMNEDKARRRVPRGPGSNGTFASLGDGPEVEYDDYDDGGKEVYSKMKATARSTLGSGRIRRPPPPPPTSIVRHDFSSTFNLFKTYENLTERVPYAKSRPRPSRDLYSPFMLDALPQHWQV